MKKITLLAVAAIAVLSMSCAKSRTCTCTTTSSGVTVTEVYTFDKIHKKNAREACEQMSVQKTTTTPAGTTTGDKTTCTLK